MKIRRQSDVKRVMQLMADRALFGLHAKEKREVEKLLGSMPDIDSEMMDIAAAAVHLAVLPNEYEPLPEDLYLKIHSRAKHELAHYRQD
jgi:hypothetical protein